MAGARGYHSYRGRGSKGKAVLSAVLVVIILAALAVIGLERYVVYDENGRPRLELPWEDAQAAQEPGVPEELEITIQPSEKHQGVRAIQLPDMPLESWDAAYQERVGMLETDDAVVLTMKDQAGNVYFDTQHAVSGAVQTAAGTAGALEALLQDESCRAIARMSCFLDPRAANADVEGMGLKNTGGYIFYDGAQTQWLDPNKRAARQYLCSLAQDLAALGFDEILLTDVSYPTEGKLDKIDYGGAVRSQAIGTFLEELAAALEPYDVTLAIELPEHVLTQGSDDTAGLVLTDIAAQVERIYVRTTADRGQALADAVAATGSTAGLVPELAAGTTVPEEGDVLRLPEQMS